MHKNEPKLEILVQMRTDATPNEQGIIVAPLTTKQLDALNSQIKRREKEVAATK